MTLLLETIEVLNNHGKATDDVLAVIINRRCAKRESDDSFDESIWFRWSDFSAIADIEYDSGYGSQEVNAGLRIVGTGWWLERHEYDGSEWWEFKQQPTTRDNPSVPTLADLFPDRCDERAAWTTEHGYYWCEYD